MKQALIPEFYDLSERILNSGDGYWGNLGYWQPGNDYSMACEGLARQLAAAVDLNPDSRVLDAGFGCGDQLLLWLRDYHIEYLCGINYSISQTELAQQRLSHAGYHDAANNIHQSDVTVLSESTEVTTKNINTVLALDCAYHFPSRKKFINDSYKILKHASNDDNKTIGFTDIILAETAAGNKISWEKRLFLNIMLRLSQIPQHNIMTLSEYENQLKQAGFEHVVSQDISDQVFLPFGHWLNSQEDSIKKAAGKRSVWLKYKITTVFLAWAYKNQVLRYVIVSAAVES
ncbi:methyltransferase-like protein [Oleispira antarctica RB-8]|uniref:Methyltransferase-like protein n=1 Tax=Oleispira antarctica RB-8 TaxID=698738 RepID=R4YLB3_OLEAN|nr:methyltransferase-like protein [Oleispira antarctica RB-8]